MVISPRRLAALKAETAPVEAWHRPNMGDQAGLRADVKLEQLTSTAQPQTTAVRPQIERNGKVPGASRQRQKSLNVGHL